MVRVTGIEDWSIYGYGAAAGYLQLWQDESSVGKDGVGRVVDYKQQIRAQASCSGGFRAIRQRQSWHISDISETGIMASLENDYTSKSRS